jgi:hypothetical protein
VYTLGNILYSSIIFSCAQKSNVLEKLIAIILRIASLFLCFLKFFSLEECSSLRTVFSVV